MAWTIWRYRMRSGVYLAWTAHPSALCQYERKVDCGRELLKGAELSDGWHIRS